MPYIMPVVSAKPAPRADKANRFVAAEIIATGECPKTNADAKFSIALLVTPKVNAAPIPRFIIAARAISATKLLIAVCPAPNAGIIDKELSSKKSVGGMPAPKAGNASKAAAIVAFGDVKKPTPKEKAG